jgi:hypothetical protein
MFQENGILVALISDYRGVEIRNRKYRHKVRKNRHDIVIEQCISFLGKDGRARTYCNIDGGSNSGIYAEKENLT